jgi:hypothetical protein
LKPPWSRIDWLIIIVFAGLVALFYWPILTPNLADRQSFPPGDFSQQFWAFATFKVRELSAGRLPLWNPYTFAGAPFWADVQSAVFYPPSLLTILLSAPWGFSLFALEIEAIAHFWLAAILMYLFVRQIIQSRPAGVIAALTFTFSGYLTGYPSQQLAVLEAVVWLPLILLFIYLAHQRLNQPPTQPSHYPTNQLTNHPSPIPLLLLAGVAWGLTLLAGHPQSALIVAYLSVAYLFFLWLTNPSPTDLPPHASRFTLHAPRFIKRTLNALLHTALFLLTGLALAAIQFIPAVEYTLLSVRAEGAYDTMSGGLPLPDLIQLLLPGQVSFYSPLYVGIVGLLLALWVIFKAPSQHTIFWASVAVISLLISFGGNTFLYSPLYLAAPGFSIFRGQERWAMAVAFSLSILAGYGFNQLLLDIQLAPRSPLSASRSPLHALRSLTKWLFLLALLLTFIFFYGLNDTGWTPASPFYNLLGAATLLTILLALAWLLWKFGPRLPLPLFIILTGALICFDLFTANWQTNLYPQLPEWHTQMPPAVAAIKQDAATLPDQPYRVYNEFRLYGNYGVPFALEDLWGASPLRPDRYDQFLAPPMPIERTWELLNVKYVITWREELFLPSTIIYREPAADGTTYVHRLENVGPRAWLVNQAEIAADDAILQKIADPGFDRWRIALLEPGAEPFINQINHAPAQSSEQLEPSAIILDSHHLSRTTYHASHFTLHVSTPIPALLILSETYYPGWQAGVDGQPAPLLRADYILRAVPVPAGEHTVELRFRPFSFTAGAVISATTLLALVTALSVTRRKKNRLQPKAQPPEKTP